MAIRGNLQKLSDSRIWHDIVTNGMKSVTAPDNRDFIAEAKRHLPPAPWDAATWKIWTDALKSATGRKGKELFMPLRLALTGLDHGPEMAQLLPLIGRQKVLERLS